MRKFLLLLIFSFLISQSFEFELNKVREFKEIRNLENNVVDTTTTDIDTEFPEIQKQLTKEKKIKPTLLGFGSFKKIIEKANNITFNIYFKNVGKNPKETFLKYIFFILTMRKTKTRMLEEDDIKKRILFGILKDDSLSKDIVEYNVNHEVTDDEFIPDGTTDMAYVGEVNKVEDYDTFEINGNFRFLNQSSLIIQNSKESLKAHLESGENAVSVQSKEDLNNLQEQTQKFIENFLFFKVYDLTQLGYLYYKIKGFFDRDMPFQKEKLNFSYIQYYEKKYFEGELEKIPDLKDIHNYNYTLTFRIKDFIDTNLDDGCKANISKYKITNKRMLEGEIIEELILYALDPDLLRLDETSPVMNHNYGRKIASSSGLSGGAIAGIVIACVVAIVGIALAFIYFKRPNIKPADVSAIEFYNNSNVNSSVEVIQN